MWLLYHHYQRPFRFGLVWFPPLTWRRRVRRRRRPPFSHTFIFKL